MCISLYFIQAQNNNNSNPIVSSDSINVEIKENKFSNWTVEGMKIPLVKKENQKVFWALPSLAWNNYDKTQVGILFGVSHLKHFSLLTAPMIGLGSKNLTGVLDARYFFEGEKVKQTTFGLKAKRFSYLVFPEDLAYNVLHPTVGLDLINTPSKALSIGFKHKSVWQEYVFQERKTQYFFLNTIYLDYSFTKDILDFSTEASLEQGPQFALFKNESKAIVNFKKHPSNAFTISSFLGSFLYNNRGNSNIGVPLPIFQLSGVSNSGIYWLQKDYGFDDFYLDRNAQDNFLQKQVAHSEGGFKSVTSAGNSNHFMFAVNMKSDVLLPEKIKQIINLQLFTNVAFTKNKNLSGALFAEGGVSILVLDEVIGFHIPFTTTKNIIDNQSTAFQIMEGAWTERISFSLDLMRLKKRI